MSEPRNFDTGTRTLASWVGSDACRSIEGGGVPETFSASFAPKPSVREPSVTRLVLLWRGSRNSGF
jgi:hypothetical protein